MPPAAEPAHSIVPRPGEPRGETSPHETRPSNARVPRMWIFQSVPSAGSLGLALRATVRPPGPGSRSESPLRSSRIPPEFENRARPWETWLGAGVFARCVFPASRLDAVAHPVRPSGPGRHGFRLLLRPQSPSGERPSLQPRRAWLVTPLPLPRPPAPRRMEPTPGDRAALGRLQLPRPPKP